MSNEIKEVVTFQDLGEALKPALAAGELFIRTYDGEGNIGPALAKAIKPHIQAVVDGLRPEKVKEFSVELIERRLMDLMQIARFQEQIQSLLLEERDATLAVAPVKQPELFNN